VIIPVSQVNQTEEIKHYQIIVEDNQIDHHSVNKATIHNKVAIASNAHQQVLELLQNVRKIKLLTLKKSKRN
jgi:hypothetical protein